MRFILDTNVVVSGMLQPRSAAGTLLRMVFSGSLDVAVDERILMEYEEVLGRPKLAIDGCAAREMLDRIRLRGQRVLPYPLAMNLPDPDDLPFIEVALASSADAIVTGNRKHFPSSATQGIPVLSPQEALESLSGGGPHVKEGILVYHGRARGDLTKAVAVERKKRIAKLSRRLRR